VLTELTDGREEPFKTFSHEVDGHPVTDSFCHKGVTVTSRDDVPWCSIDQIFIGPPSCVVGYSAPSLNAVPERVGIRTFGDDGRDCSVVFDFTTGEATGSVFPREETPALWP
jgi:hypothetical protein